MLTHLTVERFKSLQKVDIDLGSLNVFIGTNASGKSNLLDALRVLQGVGYGFTISEIFDGKPKSASSIAWDGIRGGSEGAVLKLAAPKKGPNPHKNTIRLAVHILDAGVHYEYEIGLNPLINAIRYESLSVDGQRMFATDKKPGRSPTLKARIYTGRRGQPPVREFEKSRSILSQLAKELPEPIELAAYLSTCVAHLVDMQRLDLNPGLLRDYSQRQSAERLGEHGEDFAALVKTICTNKQTRAEYVSWLRELTPAEVDDIKILKGAVKEPLFALKEGKHVFQAQVLSDGTLRFAALAAAMFQPAMPRLILLEEIENGIHPTRLRLLVELLRSRAASGDTQFLVTTHSPIVLAWLKPEEYATTFFCQRGASGISRILPVRDIPEFQSIVGKTPISDLFAEGWLESAL
ncbi:MAG: AAA family ATPase [Chloroflexi bacterium]|nr:AAA family ATPase [Chloroflexota bacterium]